MSLPGSLLPWLNRQFTDDDGVPLAGGKLTPIVAGSDPAVPKLLYSDAALTTPLPTSIVFDSAGRIEPAYLAPGGYDLLVYNSSDVLQYEIEGVEDVGLTWLSTLGQQFTSGPGTVTSGYTVLSTDYFVPVNSAAGASTINLPAAADYTAGPLTIKNMGANTVAVTPDGSDTIDTVAAAFSLPAASSPTFPSIVLLSDGISSWWIQSSHGL